MYSLYSFLVKFFNLVFDWIIGIIIIVMVERLVKIVFVVNKFLFLIINLLMINNVKLNKIFN